MIGINNPDLITIFNQLTSSELADYNLFEDILSNHYEKFRYLYSLISEIDLSQIDEICCRSSKNSISVFISPKDTGYLNDIIYSINANRHNYIFSEYFKLNVWEKEGQLNIDIELGDCSKEGDIYAHRFV